VRPHAASLLLLSAKDGTVFINYADIKACRLYKRFIFQSVAYLFTIDATGSVRTAILNVNSNTTILLATIFLAFWVSPSHL